MATQVVFEDIVRFLRAQGLEFGIGARDTIALSLKGRKDVYQTYIQYRWEKELIILYVDYPFKTPLESLPDILKLAALINWGLLFTTCEVHPETGAIRFRSTMMTDEAPFFPEQFAAMLATSCSIADRFLPAFREVVEKKHTPEKALAAIQKKARKEE